MTAHTPASVVTRRIPTGTQRPKLSLLLGYATIFATIGISGCPHDPPDRTPPTITHTNTAATQPASSPLSTTRPRTATQPSSQVTSAKATLSVREISFAGPAGHREDAIFGRGEKIVALLTVSGFTYQKGRANLVTDVNIRRDDASHLLVFRAKKLPLLSGKAPTARPGQIRGAARLTLAPAVPPGAYRVHLTVRDLLSQRQGSAEGRFQISGQRLPAAKRLALLALRNVGDNTVAPRSVVPLAFTVAGLHPKRDAQTGTYSFNLRLSATLLDGHRKRIDPQGKIPGSHNERTLSRRGLPFAPHAYPFAYGFAIPKALPPGGYRLRLTISDASHPAHSTHADLPITIIKPHFAIVSPHLYDAGHLPRSTFRFGEQAFVRFSVRGFRTTKAQAKIEVDVAVAGPGGVYLAGKNAATLAGTSSAIWAKAGRFPLQLPLRLPTLAPVGTYKVLLRARDLLAHREITREVSFRLDGHAPKPLGTFRVDKLYVRRRPDLPRDKGDTFVGGETYHLEVLAGGGKLKKIKRATYALKIRGSLRLRLPTGTIIREWKDLFHEDRTLHYQPLRVLLRAQWKPPNNLPRGLYDIEIQLLDPLRDRVSTLRKRVELIPRR
ncbi:MAG: hypothetical protein KAI47_15300 [Deltaproteobacteria bacterium]|nr:hypothetical protein [Deltaproteobacteria bacterium]